MTIDQLRTDAIMQGYRLCVVCQRCRHCVRLPKPITVAGRPVVIGVCYYGDGARAAVQDHACSDGVELETPD